jgi:large repetitive protein
VTFTATVAVSGLGSGTPAGGENVTFYDGGLAGTNLGTSQTSIIAGVPTATLSISTLSVATHSITAVYAGDGSFNTSTSSAISQVVNKVSTTTTIGSITPNTGVVVGQPYVVAFSVAILAGHNGSIPGTDTVTVSDGSQICSPVPQVSAGSCTLTSTTAGTKTITVTYTGDANNATSFTTSSQVISATGTTTTVTSSLTPSDYGTSVTFTATIAAASPGSGAPPAGETVQFFDGVTSLGTGTTTVTGGVTKATFSSSTSTPLSVNTHSITATYAGDSNYATSTATAFSQVVQKASTTITVASSANPSVFGQSVTFTAKIARVAPGTALPPAGETVQFFDGVTLLGTGTTSIVAGVPTATASFNSMPVATHSITANYVDDVNFLPSTSAILSQVVNPASTTSTVSAGTLGTATVVGQSYPVSYTVAITAPGTGTIPGTDSVTVTDGTATCTATVTAGTCTLTSMTAGTKSIKATYAGDTSFNTSTSAGVNHTVSKASTTTVITNNLLNTATIVGQPYAVNYSVTVNSPGSGTIPGTDTVSVSDGAGGTCTGTIAAGTCQLTSTTGGLLTVTASFVTDANYAASTSTGSLHDVTAASTTTTVTSSANPSVSGQTVTLTATIAPVSPATGTPANTTVTFVVDGSSIGTGASSSGVATINTSMAVVGSPHSVIAVYAGTSAWGSSVSSPMSQTVNQDSSTTVLTAAPSGLVVHTPVTFTATVNANLPGSGTAGSGETVTFMDFGTTLGTGTTNGSGVASFTTSTLAFGPHSITAVYPGDTNLTGSTSTASSQPVGTSGSATYVQPFLAGHGWTYTTFGNCTLSGSGGAVCGNNPAFTTTCATSPCVEASAASGSGSTGGGQQGYFQNQPGTLTWASLGVPAGATVLTVQGSWWDTASSGCGTTSNAPANTTAEMEVVDVNGNWVTGTGGGSPLVSLVTVAGDTAATHTGSVLPVLSQDQASSTIVNLRLDLSPEVRNTTGQTCTLSADNFQLVITYVSPAGKRGQVTIGFNNTPAGPMSNMWLPKFEPVSN